VLPFSLFLYILSLYWLQRYRKYLFFQNLSAKKAPSFCKVLWIIAQKADEDFNMSPFSPRKSPYIK
jgi:hypothetical protein